MAESEKSIEMTILSELIRSGLVVLRDGRCRCRCGGDFSELSASAHVKTKRHIVLLKRIAAIRATRRAAVNNPNISRCDPKECSICYMDKTEFFTCTRCKNAHCVPCHNSIIDTRNLKCPFCRTAFPRLRPTPRPVPNTPRPASSSRPNQPVRVRPETRAELFRYLNTSQNALYALLTLAINTPDLNPSISLEVFSMIRILEDKLAPTISL